METIDRFDEFIREYYHSDLIKSVKDEKALVVDFSLLDRFDPLLADQLLETPESVLEVFDEAAQRLVNEPVHVRTRNLPESRQIRIRNLRAKHMSRLWTVDAIIKAASEVKPQIYSATFECPECSAKIIVPQETNIVQKPSQCECGRRGDFKLVGKEMYDIRWLTGVEPFEITTGEQPGQIAILLKEDLTTPRMQKKTDPGSKLKITGVLREIPKRIKGKLSTKLDMYIEVNHVESSDVEFEDLDITPEDEALIKDMAADPTIYEKLRNSIATGIYGFDEIKEAVLLQLFGGVPHVLPDGSRVRGNIHILITGDPSIGKSITGSSRILHNSDEKPEYTTIANLVDRALEKQKIVLEGDTEISQINDENIKVISVDPKTLWADWKPVSTFIRHKSPEYLIKITTKSGREITATEDHSFVILDDEGEFRSLPGRAIVSGSYIPIPMNTHRELITEISIDQPIRTNAKKFSDRIPLDWDFGFFLGMFLSEGSLRAGSNTFQISIASNDAKRKEKIQKFIERIGLSAHSDERSINISSRNLARFMSRSCYKGKKMAAGKGSGASRKCIPSFCFYTPKDFISGLLSGMFSGDGFYWYSKSGNYKESLKIGYGTISGELAYGLVDMLSLTGIFSILRKKRYSYKGEKRISYEVHVLGRHAEHLLQKIKMIGKQKKIDNFSEKDTFDVIPATKLLYDIVRSLGYSKRYVPNADRRRAFGAMMRTVRSRKKIGRRRMERIYKQLLVEAGAQNNRIAMEKLRKLGKILDSNVVWDSVVSVEKIMSSEKYVYDLSVDGNENFAANNLIVHNSVLLKLVTSIVPRGRYVSGSGVSGAGLTATVVKNEAIGGWILEAGALILCNKGLIGIDEFDKMSRDDQIAMHEAMSIESYHGDTPITLAGGDVKTIREIVEGEFIANEENIKKGNNCYFIDTGNIEILGTDFEKISTQKIIRISKHTAPDFFYKIKLQNGRGVTVTPSHPCFVFDGTKFIEKPADKLSKGEFMPIPRSMPISGCEQQLDIDTSKIKVSRYNAKHIEVPAHNSPQFCKFIGYLISEGSHEMNRNKINGISFTNSNKNLLEDFESTAHALFHIKPYRQKKHGRTMLRYISTELSNFVREIEPSLLRNAGIKKIPPIIFRCRKEDISVMLRAMFDGDGSVSAGKNSLYVTYTTASETLANQIHELLLRFSIVSYINTTEPRGRTKQRIYRVLITGSENLKNFLDSVRFSEPAKNKKIEKFLRSKEYRATYSEKIPAGPFLVELLKKLRLSQKDVFGGTIPYRHFNISRKTLQKAVIKIENHLSRLRKLNTELPSCDIPQLRRIRREIGVSTFELSDYLKVCHQMVSYVELRNVKKYRYNYIAALLSIISKILEIEDSIKVLRSLAFGDITLCKIHSVEKIKNEYEEWVYDITVPGKIFVSDGMVLHNSVSIAKASIVATLPAQTAVLAGANPKRGRFDPYLSIAEQIDIPETLLSRFDLKFALRDLPDKTADERLASHVLTSRMTPEFIEPPVDTKLLRKYVAYAKKNAEKIELTQEAAEVIKNFYVEMRNMYTGESVNVIAITLRQYEALLRLAEASAKIRLDNKVRMQDAERAIRLMQYSLRQLGMDTETGKIDIDRMESGVTATKRRRISVLIEILERLQKDLGSREVPIDDLKAEAEQQGLERIDEVLDMLIREGTVFTPKPGFVRKV